MKKLVAVVTISGILIVILLVLAFFYVDLSGHRGSLYNMTADGMLSGHIRIDKYVTEDKIVYKSNTKYIDPAGYTAVDSKLFLRKQTGMPLRFIEEAYGARGQKKLTLLIQNGDKTDFLFLEHPRFITLKGFETGRKTAVFSPYDVMLYMPIMARYNFWRKGTQFFEIMIPVDEPVPPVQVMLEVKYLKDEYVTIMGRKVEAETFAVKAGVLPVSKVFMSKRTHRILVVEIEKMKIRFILVKSVESSGKRIKPLLDRVNAVFNRDRTDKNVPEKETGFFEEDQPVRVDSHTTDIKTIVPEPGTEVKKKKEIFFENGNTVLSGYMWVPAGEGPFPAILMIPEDGPRMQEEQYMLDSFGDFLSASGFLVLVFDSPGQGKSQGNFLGLDDNKRIQNIISAIAYLNEQSFVKKGSINLLGYKGGGYLALKAGEKSPAVRTCILLGISSGPLKTDPLGWFSAENLRSRLNTRGFDSFDEKGLNQAAEKAREQIQAVKKSTERFSFFSGIKLPLGWYREYLERKPYETVISFNKPVLIVFGRDESNFDLQIVDEIKRVLGEKNPRNRVAVFRNPGIYMGKMVRHDNSRTFEASEDVLELIRNWVVEDDKYGADRSEGVEPVAIKKVDTVKNVIEA